MKFVKDFFSPRINKILGFLGLLAGVIQLISLALLNLPNVIQVIAFVFIVIFVLYFLIEFLLFLRTSNTTAEIAFDFSARRYGIGYDIQDIDCIIDRDGSAIVQRSPTILAFSEINSIDTYLLVPEAADPNQTRDVGLLNIKSLSQDRIIQITNRKKEYQRSSVEISFAPPLLSGDDARFQLTEELPSELFAINLNRDQLGQRKTPYDYFAWNINRPTRHLKMQIFIPEAYNPPEIFRAEVRYASASGLPDERIQFAEQQRVQKPKRTIAEGRCTLTLEVDYPMIGLIYLIRWDPIPRDI